jgi:hypothetical protein
MILRIQALSRTIVSLVELLVSPLLLCYALLMNSLGSTALVSLGGYTYYSGMQQLRLQRKAIELSKSRYKYGSRQLGIITLSATFISMGIYRMFN